MHSLASTNATSPTHTSRQIPAWMLSCLLHTTILTVGAFSLHVVPRGVEDPGRGTGIVLVATSPAGQTSYFADTTDAPPGARGGQANASPAVNAFEAPTPALALPGREQLPKVEGPALPTVLPNAGLPGNDANLPGAGDLTGGGIQGNGLNSGTGEATVNVFGVKGTGSRFVFVFDRSASMSGYAGRPLAAAKRELITSLQGLGKVHQFQIIFYNEEPHVFNARPGQSPNLYFADDQAKEQATAFVNGITGSGGTQHVDALVKALGMGPDVIFFLTDADEPKLTDDELHRIRDKNRRGTVINAVEFGAGPSTGDDTFLHRLSRQNRGQHSYVDVTTLPASR